MAMLHRLFIVAALATAAATAAAQTVTLNGRLGSNKALLVIDGEPVTVAVGGSVRGVRLLTLTETAAEVDVAGTRRSLPLATGPVRNVGAPAPSGREIVLTAGQNGHFRAVGAINGRSVEFMVDTGASLVSMGQEEADRLGLDWRSGTKARARTANGDVPIYVTTLSAVRLGDVEVANVEAAIHPGSAGVVLLGNSFLSRFQMRRDNDTMRLEKRP